MLENTPSFEVSDPTRSPAAAAEGSLLAPSSEAGRSRSGPKSQDPDRELVERWKTGDESAFEQLVERHQKRVFRLLLRMMGDRDEAEDVTQETFLSLYRHGQTFRCESLFSTFVYRVAANAALNRRRSLGRTRARMQKLAERQAAGDHLPSEPRGPEDAAEGGELTGHVRDALNTLPTAHRTPVVLYDIEGLSYGEIAEVLGVAEGTVKSRIHRARQALRDELRERLPDAVGNGNRVGGPEKLLRRAS